MIPIWYMICVYHSIGTVSGVSSGRCIFVSLHSRIYRVLLPAAKTSLSGAACM